MTTRTYKIIRRSWKKFYNLAMPASIAIAIGLVVGGLAAKGTL